MKTTPLLFFTIAAAFSIASVQADVRLPALFSDHAVLQKSAHVPVWGKADAGEKVTVTLGNRSAAATAGADGRWRVELDLADSAAGPFALTVEGKNKVTVSDVLVGEVWLASGQSNMEFLLKNSAQANEEIARPANPLLRQFIVIKNASPEPVDDVKGSWALASPEKRGGFSAVAYYFSKKLQSELGVPVGAVHSSWGGTPSEAWTSAESMDSVPDLKAARQLQAGAVAEYPAKKKAWVDAMAAWLKATAREDRATADTAAFSGVDSDTSAWVSVKIPGEIKAAGLPATGAVWVRREVMLPSKPATDLWLNLPINGFDAVYWNGKKLAQTTFETFEGVGHARAGGAYTVPAREVLEGRNVLAIRLFEPATPAKFTAEPKLGSQALSGEWRAKAEFELPPPAADKPAPEPVSLPMLPQYRASHLFNGMLHPLIPYAMRGAIWYQGESNASRAFQYRTAFPLMISDWRKQWKQDGLPFYFCQLANYMAKKAEPAESNWAELREAQSLALRLPNTGQAVLIDLGESGDIHPRNKKDPGERLALLALAKDYGKPVACSGPVFDSVKIENGKAILRFQHTEGGLVARPLPDTYLVSMVPAKTAPLVRNSPGSQLEGFALCGADKKWVWADAKIEGETVIVSSEKIPAPVAVRYAWADNPTCNLSNGAGLPASPFRTDDFPPVTLSGKY